jgi:zinc-finger of transposase IS204/IS1001/IS1096/IS1165
MPRRLRSRFRASKESSACPSCGTASRRVHSRYYRRVGDLPLSGRSVELMVIARLFRCEVVLCGQQIFVERFANNVLAPSARRTGRGECQSRLSRCRAQNNAPDPSRHRCDDDQSRAAHCRRAPTNMKAISGGKRSTPRFSRWRRTMPVERLAVPGSGSAPADNGAPAQKSMVSAIF